MAIGRPEDHSEVQNPEQMEQFDAQREAQQEAHYESHDEMLNDIENTGLNEQAPMEGQETEQPSETNEASVSDVKAEAEEAEPFTREQMIDDINNLQNDQAEQQFEQAVEDADNMEYDIKDSIERLDNAGFSIDDVSQAVDMKESYEAEIRDMSQDEYHDQKELDKRVEENGSIPDMTETSVSDNTLQQMDVSKIESERHDRLNETEQKSSDTEISAEEEVPANNIPQPDRTEYPRSNEFDEQDNRG